MADTNTNEPIKDLSFEEIRASLNGSAKTEETPKPADSPVESTPEAEDKTPAEPEQSEQQTEQPPTGDKKDRRFSKVTRERDAAVERAAALERELLALRTTPAKPAEQAPAAAPAATEGKPVPPNAETFQGTWQELETARAKYAEDLADWKVAEAFRKRDAEAQVAQQRVQAQQVQETFQQQVDRALDQHGEDFETAYKAVGNVVGKLGIQDVIKESEVAAEIIMQLHNDAASLEKISKMSMASAARELGRIEDRILAKKSTGTATATSAKTLPKPPAVVGGAPAGDPATPNLADVTDFRMFKNLVNKARGR